MLLEIDAGISVFSNSNYVQGLIEINKFRIQDGIVLNIGRISPDFQFKTQDPDRVGYRENLEENVAADEETALTDKEDHAV